MGEGGDQEPVVIRVRSRNGVPVRLTEERWNHIIEEHTELAGLQEDVLRAVSEPERVLAGGAEELLAIREFEPGKWLVTVYRELEEDGFIITAFLTGGSALSTEGNSYGRSRHPAVYEARPGGPAVPSGQPLGLL